MSNYARAYRQLKADDIEITRYYIQPEKRLLLKVLGRARADLMFVGFGSSWHARRGKTAHALDALEWVRFEKLETGYAETSDDLFSFEWICQHLDLDPNIVALVLYKGFKESLNQLKDKKIDKSYCDHIDSIIPDRLRRYWR